MRTSSTTKRRQRKTTRNQLAQARDQHGRNTVQDKQEAKAVDDPPEVVRKFTDTKNRTWVVFFTLDAIRRVREQCDYNPLDILDNQMKLLSKVGGDPLLLCASVYAVCEPEIKEAGLTPEQFGSGWDGDTWRAAAEVYFSAIADFIRGDGRATILRLLSHGDAMAARALNIAKLAVNGFDATSLTDEEVLELYRSATSSRESAESIPAGTASTSST